MPAVEPPQQMLACRSAAQLPPGEVPGWAGTEVRDPDGVVLGHVASLRFDPWTRRPSELVVSLPDGSPAVVPAMGMRLRLDHVVVAVRTSAPLGAPALAAAA